MRKFLRAIRFVADCLGAYAGFALAVVVDHCHDRRAAVRTRPDLERTVR